MSERPLGVSSTAVLMLLSSGGLFMLYFFNIILLAVGGAGNTGGIDWFYVVLHYPTIPLSLTFSVCAFFLSICSFKLTTKYVWYASILFWLALLGFFCWWDFVVWTSIGLSSNENGTSTWILASDWQYEIVMVTMLPLAYSVGCLVYFQTAKVKNYFKIKKTSSPLTSTEKREQN